MPAKNVGTLSVDIDGYRALVNGDMVASVSLGKLGLGITEAIGEKTSKTFGASGKFGAFVGFEAEAMRGDYVVAVLKCLGDVARRVIKRQIDLTPVLKKYVKMDDKIIVIVLFTEAKKNLLLLDTREKVVLTNSINKGIGETGMYAKVGGNKLQRMPFVEPDVQKGISSF